MTKREKVQELMKIKGYFHCIEKRLRCLEPLFPHLQTEDGIKTPLSVGTEIKVEEIIERMTDLYEKYWDEEEIDEMLSFFKSPVGQKLMSSGENLTRNLMCIMDAYIMEKMQEMKKNKLH
jgi:hypothetical protein